MSSQTLNVSRALRLVFVAALLVATAGLGATPLRLDYTISGTSAPYSYTFTLTCDNNDGSWAQGQSFGYLGFADSTTSTSPLLNFQLTSGFPQGSASGAFPSGTWSSLVHGPVTGGAVTHDLWMFWSPLNTWVPQGVSDSITWAGTASNVVGAGQMFWSAFYCSGQPADMEPGYYTAGGGTTLLLELDPTIGAVQQVIADEQGAGNLGLEVGKFTLTNLAAVAGDVDSIRLDASGTGNDSTAYAQVAMFLDNSAAGTAGSFDPADSLYGTAAQAFPTNDGTLTFTQTLAFAPSQLRTFFVVIKLGGSALPAPQASLEIGVGLVTLGAAGFVQPTAAPEFPGVQIKSPVVTFADTSPASQAGVAPGSTNAVVGSFSMTITEAPAMSMVRVEVSLSYGGPGTAADLTRLAVYRDTNMNNAVDGPDSIAGFITVAGWTNNITMSVAVAKAPPAFTQRYIVAADFSGSAPNGASYSCSINVVDFSYTGWLPAGLPTGSSAGVIISSTPSPEVGVERNATAIADQGADTVTGTAAVPLVLNYTIRNTGTAPLTITLNVPDPTAQMNCTAAITGQPAGTVAAGGSTTIQVTVTPAAPGNFFCWVSVGNNDSNEDPYDWDIVGSNTPLPLPEMDIERAATAIASGSWDVGVTGVPATLLTLTYIIRNTGTGPLALSNVAPPGAQLNCTASIQTQPATTVAAGGSTTMVVAIVPSATGAFGCTIDISNNDSNEDPYNWMIVGNAATPAPECDVLRVVAVADSSTDAVGNAQFGAASSFMYTIENNGTDDLVLTLPIPAPTAQVSCVASIATQPAASVVAPGSSTFFIVEVTPAAGPFACVVTFQCNDANEATYNWTLAGFGANTPEIDVQRPAGTSVPHNGFQLVGSAPAGTDTPYTFTVANLGPVALNVGAVTFQGEANCIALVTVSPAASVNPTSNTTFTVSVQPAAIGSFSVTLVIANDDGDESPYLVTLLGTASAPSVTSGSGNKGGGGGCAAAPAFGNAHPWMLAGIALAAITYVRLRRRNAQ